MIGLLSPHGAVNYGTRLQAYAVQTLFSKFDQVELIDYYPSIIEKGRRKVDRIMLGLEKYNDVKIQGNSKHDDPRNVLIRRQAINRFNDYFALSAPIKTKYALIRRTSSYSSVICGSDQIWNPRLIANHINLLEFVPDNIKKISIAASFGVSALPDNIKDYYRQQLTRFSYISVREKSACNIVKELGIDGVFWSLDPTLIIDSKIWEELAEKGKAAIPNEPYVFCYFLGTHQLGRSIAKKVSEKNGKISIVNLPHFKQYVEADAGFGDIDLYDIGIPEFVALIKNASAIVTDSFHGTAFSIIFRQDVYCTPRHIGTDSGNTNNRISSLLFLLGIKNRMISDEKEIELALREKIDFHMCNGVLNRKNEECIEYFTEALR